MRLPPLRPSRALAPTGAGLSGFGLYTVLGRADSFISPSRLARLHFALLCVARDLGWCDHDYPRWDEHTLCNGQLKGPPVLGPPASIMGSELPPYVRGSDPSLWPAPMPQGVSYVHTCAGSVHKTSRARADAFILLHVHGPPLDVVVAHATRRPSEGLISPLGGPYMQDCRYELLRIPLLETV